MEYKKCPICEEKLKNGICPMCGYDFNRLGQSRMLKDGHWDILTTNQKTNQPVYVHDEKRHPNFKTSGNNRNLKTQKRSATYTKNRKEKKKSRKGKRAIILVVIYLLQFIIGILPDLFSGLEDFISEILTGLNL